MKKKKIYPAPGLVVRNPETMVIVPPEGATITMNKHWKRRLACGDVLTQKPRGGKKK